MIYGPTPYIYMEIKIHTGMKPIPSHLLELKSCTDSNHSDPDSYGLSKGQTVADIIIESPLATGASLDFLRANSFFI